MGYGDACIDTYNARKAEGIIGCQSASSLAVEAVKSETNWPPPKQCPRTAAGQRSIYDPHCSGTGCGAPYNDPDCAFCVYDMTACKKAYGGACMDTYNARKAEGIIGCKQCPRT